jgi:hypothetical protein
MQEKRNGNPCKIDKQMLETFHILWSLWYHKEKFMFVI